MQADSGIAKIRSLLIAARPRIVADSRELALAVQKPLHAPGDPVTDQSPAISRLIEEIAKLRADIRTVEVSGSVAESARDLSLVALLETHRALADLADTYVAADQTEATILLARSVSRLRDAKVAGINAAKVLGIPWPIQ